MPFVYVPGSHRLTPQRLDWERRMSIAASRQPAEGQHRLVRALDPAQLGELGLPPPRAISAPANTLVVADTFGFHARGPSARPADPGRDLGDGPAQPVPAVDRARPVVGRRPRSAQADPVLEIGRCHGAGSASAGSAGAPAATSPRSIRSRPGARMDGYELYASAAMRHRGKACRRVQGRFCSCKDRSRISSIAWRGR